MVNKNKKDKSVDNKEVTKKVDLSNNFFIKNYNALAFLVLIILALSLYLFNSSSIDDPYEFYNGYEFVKHPLIDDVWSTTIKIGESEEVMEFYYHPLDLVEFDFDLETTQYFFLNQMSSGNVYISFSQDVLNMSSGYLSRASYDLARILHSFLGFTVDVSITDSFDTDKNYSVINCGDAQLNLLVLELRKGSPRIEADNFCVQLFFEDPVDSSKLASLLIYKLLGVMD